MLISVFDKLDGEQATSAHLGGKGHGLWWMQQQGVNVPPALIIPTTVCVEYMKAPKGTMKKIKAQLPTIKEFFKSQFGYMPLLSVRSGARVSMPGMMDTILNVGLDDQTMPFWQEKLGEQCVIDSYKRLITMYGNVVKGIDRQKLEKDSALAVSSAYQRATKEPFPETEDQILNSIEAVFQSWNNERAKIYRKMHQIPEEWGTAVVLQSMVFGNLNDNSGTGVLFTRNPDSGEDKVTGEFLTNAQGEDVVAGIRTPMPLSQMPAWNKQVADELMAVVVKLETAKKDVQDVEFTIQDGKLYVLQTRNAKRSARAAVKIALDMLEQGMLTQEQALKRVSTRELDLADLPVVDPKFKVEPKYKGIPACSGVAVGKIALSSESAVQMAAKGIKVVMVTDETTPDDIAGMVAACGILTMTGGATSHAAVVARSMNRVCVVGLGVDHGEFTEGEDISLDGATGGVWDQAVPVIGGYSEDVRKFRNLVIGEGSLLAEQPPTYPVERLVIDLVPSLIETDAEIEAMLTIAHMKSKQLTVMIAKPTDEQMEILSVFCTPERLEQRLKAVRKMVVNLELEGMTCMGWDNPKASAIDCVNLGDLPSLVLTTKSGLMLGKPPTDPIEQKAFEKVMKWLEKDGVTLKQMNVKGSVASWTTHVAP